MGNRFQKMVQLELELARGVYPQPFNSMHEGFAVLKEEVDEVWDEIKKKPALRNRTILLGELVQIAAMAQRFAEDLLQGSCP